MRLIDADTLTEKELEQKEYWMSRGHGDGGTNIVLGALEQAPTVPAEIVCRCKDCVHSQYDALLGGYWCNGKNHSGLWFCADGERRESEERP